MFAEILGQTLPFLNQFKLLIAACFPAWLVASCAWHYYKSPFRKQNIPGPLLGKLTNGYRWYYTMRHTWHRDLMALHEKYGQVIWIAPDDISVSDPFLRNVIYGFQNHKKDQTFFRKAPSYETGSVNQDFSFIFEQDPAKARLGKYHMSHFYSEAGLATLEENFDKAVDELVEGLDKHHVQTGKPCKFVEWTEYFGLDVSSQIACNTSAGFCLAGKDLGNTAWGIRVIFQAIGAVMVMPWVWEVTSRALRMSLISRFLIQLYRAMLVFPSFTFENGSARIHEIKDKNPNHLLARSYQAQLNMRKHFPIGNEVEGTMIQIFNLIAGSFGVVPHTTVKLMYELLLHPEAMERIMQELSQIKGDITFADFLKYNGAINKLPYLEGAAREAIRLSPSASFTLSRVVPPAGCQLHQYHIPPGKIVGMSSYPVNYDKGYFGDDVAEFKPERWIGDHPTEMLDGEPRTMKNWLEAGWLSFGHGGRICLGRHLALFMMMKFFGRVLRTFDFELLSHPYEYYTLMSENLGMEVMVRRKAPGASVVAGVTT